MECSSFAVGKFPIGGDAGESRLEKEKRLDRIRAAIGPTEGGVLIGPSNQAPERIDIIRKPLGALLTKRKQDIREKTRQRRHKVARKERALVSTLGEQKMGAFHPAPHA